MPPMDCRSLLVCYIFQTSNTVPIIKAPQITKSQYKYVVMNSSSGFYIPYL
jgi:hypothetical protein